MAVKSLKSKFMKHLPALNLAVAINALINLDIDISQVEEQTKHLFKIANVEFKPLVDVIEIVENTEIAITDEKTTAEYFFESINHKATTYTLIYSYLHITAQEIKNLN